LTGIAAGLTVWSGIDAENHPGRDAVRADCMGQGTACPEYQRGLSAQLRTNVLLSTTCVVAAATLVAGLFFTQWSHRPPAGAATAGRVRLAGAGLLGEF
jgi:hypothetical protein